MRASITRNLIRSATCALVMAGVLGVDLGGYATSGHKWAAQDVSYYVNAQSIHLSQAAAVSAIQRAADVWSTQSDASVRFVYAGSTSGSSLTLNRKNEVFFRNGSNGSYIAETYWWYDGSGALVDADIVFYEGSYRFFTNSGCVDGIYLEDVAVHELGHALGIEHSSITNATMYKSMPGYCDLTQMTLEADDIAAVESVYPPGAEAQPPAAPSGLAVAVNGTYPTSSLVLSWSDNASNETGYRIERSADGATFSYIAQVGANVRSFTNTGLAADTTYFYRVYAYNGDGQSAYSNVASGRTQSATQTNTAPTVSISNPLNSAVYPADTTISFAGTATDTQDGNLTSGLKWTSSLSGQIGTGGSFSRTLAAGTHVITASATDAGGLTGTRQVSISVTISGQTGPLLSVRGYKVKGSWQADLTWWGITALKVDILRDGARMKTTANDGSDTDAIGRKGGGSVTYRVCGEGTSVCSNTVTVTF